MRPWPTFSTRCRDRTALLLLAGLALIAAALSLSIGSVPLSPAQVLGALTGRLTGTVPAQIVRFVRLPRTLACLATGAALATSGAVIQGVLANPLAAPNIIGVNSGAGLAAALCCALLPSMPALVPVLSFLGALAGVLLVLLLAQRTGAARITLVLAVVAVSSIFGAGIDAVLTFVPEALNGYSDFRIGSLANVSLDRVRPAGGLILAALAAVLWFAKEMDLLLLGADTAQSLGLPVKRIRLTLLTLAAALAGAAVSLAGLLGFVGLLVPHMMRRLVGEDSRTLLLASALGGAALLTGCDLLARVLFAPYELPVGIVLSLLGGPFFLWLLLGRRRGRTP